MYDAKSTSFVLLYVNVLFQVSFGILVCNEDTGEWEVLSNPPNQAPLSSGTPTSAPSDGHSPSEGNEGTIDDGSTLNVPGDLSLNPGDVLNIDGTLVVQGKIDLSQGQINLGPNGRLVVNGMVVGKFGNLAL